MCVSLVVCGDEGLACVYVSTKEFVVLNVNCATYFKLGRIVHLFRWFYMPLFGFTN